MRVERGKVGAPEIGRVWLNSPPLSVRFTFTSCVDPSHVSAPAVTDK